MLARSKAMIDKWAKIYSDRFAHDRNMARHFGNNPMAFAAGRSFDTPDKPKTKWLWSTAIKTC